MQRQGEYIKMQIRRIIMPIGCTVAFDTIFECNNVVNIFFTISFNICFVYSKEPSHGDGSTEYPHNFWLRFKKKC